LFASVAFLTTDWFAFSSRKGLQLTSAEQAANTPFSRPAWWKWPFDAVFALVMWFGIPIVLAISLFHDRKTSDYFTEQTA
jgi:hypothetical protein